MKRVASKFLSLCLVMVMSLTMLASIGQKDVSASYVRYVTADFLNIRKSASGSSKVLGKYYWKDSVTCIGKNGSWTKVSFNDGEKGYVATEYLASSCPEVKYKSSYTRYVTEAVNVRTTPCSGSVSLGSYSRGTKVTCYGTSGNWTVVKKNGEEGFVTTDSLSSKKVSAVSKGEEIAAYAKQFVGNPYRWGGTSLTNGADCSGFVMSVYKHFGYNLPRTSSSQRYSGTGVSLANRKVGDLICYSGHIGIYIGNNQIVHASNSKPYPRGGIKISSMYIMNIQAVRRVAN